MLVFSIILRTYGKMNWNLSFLFNPQFRKSGVGVRSLLYVSVCVSTVSVSVSGIEAAERMNLF